jgi:hypothetical protein
MSKNSLVGPSVIYTCNCFDVLCIIQWSNCRLFELRVTLITNYELTLIAYVFALPRFKS